MNKKLMFLLIMGSVVFYCLPKYDIASLDAALISISEGSTDVDMTETINELALRNAEDCSLLQSFKKTVPLACCGMGVLSWKLVKNGVQAFVYGFGFTYEDDPSNKIWFICDKDGNKHIVTRAAAWASVKSSLLITGSLWAIFGLGHYIYQKQQYKQLVAKILHDLIIDCRHTPVELAQEIKRFHI